MTTTESDPGVRPQETAGALPGYMTIAEIASYIRVTEDTARRLCDAGRIKAAKPTGGDRSPWVSRKDWVDAYIDSIATGGQAAPQAGPLRPRPDLVGRRRAAKTPEPAAPAA